ncbi:hypothetical protein DFH07DRAFT_299347 [Mycena maculata]|uniref:Uncharacterized protein n=1 Tax=Mycena maculata TaxID=230809 RepID=A0AAD7JQP4_9AGAR|nr:hypothetical protein DFH07DRAFT_299347 [Mycena maculata]
MPPYHVLSGPYLELSQALRAFSETCRRLRSVFQAWAWEHLKVCAHPKVSDQYRYNGSSYLSRPFYLWSPKLALDFAKELVRQTEIVTIRNLALASEVRIRVDDWTL